MRNNTSSGLESVLEKLSRSLADRFGINLICQGDKCCTDGKNIYLPSLPDDIPKDLLRAIHGWVDHECAHICENTDMKVAKEFRERFGPHGFFLLNILEDLRVEEGMRKRFPGSGYNLARCYEFAVEDAAKETAMHPMRQLAFAINTRVNGQPDLLFVAPETYSAVEMVESIVNKVAKCANTKKVAALAEEAWKILEPLLTSQQQPPPPPQNASSNGENQSDGQPQSQGSSPDQAPDSPSSNTDTPESAPSQSHNGNNEQRDEHLQGILGDLGDAIASQVRSYADNHQSYRVWNTKYDRVMLAENAPYQTHSERMASVMPHVSGVRQRLLQTLLAEPRARWRGDLEEGAVNPRALHRLVCPAAGREGSPRVFRRRERVKKLRTAVTLLVDESNSMSGRRIKLAAETALVFCEALSRLNIAANVIGFSTAQHDPNLQNALIQTGLSKTEIKARYRTIPLRHTVYKRFGEQFHKVSGRMDSMRAQSLTPLGESMLFAAKVLAERHEERKVLFVITDGMPAVDLQPEGITFSHAREAIKRIEKAGVDVALLGIMTPSVADLHHRSVVINRVDDLPRAAMRQLQNILTK